MARKQKNIHYIYKTTCNVTGKWYVGMHSTLNINDGYMGSGTILRHSIRKHGIDNHIKEILEFLETRELLIEREIEIITKELISNGLCMNLKEGGSGGFCNEEHMKNCSKAGNIAKKIKLDTDLEYRQNHINKCSLGLKKYNESGKNDSPRFTGKQHTEETLKLMREINKGNGVGETNSQYGTCWITKEGINKKINKEEFENHQLEGWKKGRV